MQRRETKLPDGRYLIYYDFDEEVSSPAPGENEELIDPLAQPEAEEERRV